MVASSRDVGWHVTRNGGVSRGARDGAKPLWKETAMPPQTTERRLEKLEEQVTNLQQRPARIDALSLQIRQVREDLGGQISAAEQRLMASHERILAQMRVLHEDVVARLALIQEGRRTKG